jgi:GH24 family phage-related lysozyme (muramidase)
MKEQSKNELEKLASLMRERSNEARKLGLKSKSLDTFVSWAFTCGATEAAAETIEEILKKENEH